MAFERELFADEATTPAKHLALSLALYVLGLFKYGRILSYPDERQTSKIGEAAVLEAYKESKGSKESSLFMLYLKEYPCYLTLESHDEFVKTCFLKLYNDCKFGETFKPFIRICAFTKEMLIYIHDRRLRAVFFDNTITLLARVFSSDEFNSKTNLEGLVLNCSKYTKKASKEDVAEINRVIWHIPEFKRVACDCLQIF